MSSAVAPLTAFAQWLGLSYLDYKRFKTLKNAVDIAHPVLERAAAVASSQAVGFSIAGATELHRRGSQLLNRVANTSAGAGHRLTDEADVAQAIEQYAAATALAQLSTVSALDAMVAAHAALRAELKNPTTQREPLIKAIREFYTHAKASLAAVS